MEAYYQWLRTSKNGQDEKNEKNNHGTWCDAQTAQIALWLGHQDDARAIIQAALSTRLARQVEPDGRHPLELKRTKSLNYSFLNLEGLFRLAQMGERVGVDWWNYQTTDGRSMLQALRFVAVAAADSKKEWVKDDLVEADRDRIYPLLAEAARHSQDPMFRELYERYVTPTAAVAPWQLFR
jgi:hypothetical protein